MITALAPSLVLGSTLGHAVNAAEWAFESAPVVDIDNTVFLQLILFLFLFAVLNVFLFKPWLEVRERRAKKIEGAVVEAALLRTAAQDTASSYDQRLAAAREQAMVVRSDSRRAAEAEEAAIVAAARNEAAAELDAHKRTLAQEAGQARAELGGRIDALAGDITQQILGRSA